MCVCVSELCGVCSVQQHLAFSEWGGKGVNMCETVFNDHRLHIKVATGCFSFVKQIWENPGWV